MWQVRPSWWQQARAHRWHCLWLCRARPGSHPGFSIPTSLPQRHCRMGGNPSAPSKNSFLWEVWNEENQACDGHNTLKGWNSYEVVENVLVFFSQKIGFPVFLLVCFIMANFPLQGAVQGFHFLLRADSKSSFIQEKMKPSPGILGLIPKLSLETRGIWGILATISHHFPFQKANERHCQSWTGWVLLIQHFQRGQEVSRVCSWNVRQPQFSTQVGRQILLWCKLLIKFIPSYQWQYLKHFS